MEDSPMVFAPINWSGLPWDTFGKKLLVNITKKNKLDKRQIS